MCKCVFVKALLVGLSVGESRSYIQNSWIGRGLKALKDDELAAECPGVPTWRLKLLACFISRGADVRSRRPPPMYGQYADPSSAFNLKYSVSALAMALIGGTAHGAGPIIGAILLSHDATIADVTSLRVKRAVDRIMLVLFVSGRDRRASSADPQGFAAIGKEGRRMMLPKTMAPLLLISGA